MSEMQEPRWYVVHTYSGHENKVKTTPVFLSNSFLDGHETLFNSVFVSLTYETKLNLFLAFAS